MPDPAPALIPIPVVLVGVPAVLVLLEATQSTTVPLEPSEIPPELVTLSVLARAVQWLTTLPEPTCIPNAPWLEFAVQCATVAPFPVRIPEPAVATPFESATVFSMRQLSPVEIPAPSLSLTVHPPMRLPRVAEMPMA